MKHDRIYLAAKSAILMKHQRCSLSRISPKNRTTTYTRLVLYTSGIPNYKQTNTKHDCDLRLESMYTV